MTVYGRLRKGEEAGRELYTGDFDWCMAYVKTIVTADYDELSICWDDGVIFLKLINYSMSEKAMQMNKAQLAVARFASLHCPGSRLEPHGRDEVRLYTPDGRRHYLSVNIFGDVLTIRDGGGGEVIAVSDLPHSLDVLPISAEPKEWTVRKCL